MDRRTGKTLATELGNRDEKTVQKLYDKFKHLTHIIYYTDNWDSFIKVLPSDRHIIGKQHTVTIERDNSNTRHNLGRFNRRTKIVSKSEDMVNVSIKLWRHTQEPHIFEHFRNIFLNSIYRS